MNGLYAVLDKQAGHYGRPMMCATPGVAWREFSTAVFDGESMISRFPLDYDLMYLGSYNVETGEIVPVGDPELVVSAEEIRRRAAQEKGDG